MIWYVLIGWGLLFLLAGTHTLALQSGYHSGYGDGSRDARTVVDVQAMAGRVANDQLRGELELCQALNERQAHAIRDLQCRLRSAQ